MVSKALATPRKPASVSLFAEIPGYSFNVAGQLQGRAMSVSEPKQIVLHQSAFVYYMQDPSY